MAHYSGSDNINFGFTVTTQNHISASARVPFADWSCSVAGLHRALSATIYFNWALNYSALYAGHDFVTNQNPQDVIEGSSPVNIGTVIHSNG